jgi:CRP/FNR family cyclic AMP-dependent transcriptional regulator
VQICPRPGQLWGRGVISPERLKDIAFWAKDLSADECDRAARGVMEKTYEAGAYLTHRGDKFDSWTGVVSGLVKVGAISSVGKAVALAGFPAGMWFGEGSLLKGEMRRYDIVVLRKSRIALMNRSAFFWLFDNSVAFNRFLVRQFNERLGQFIGSIEQERTLDATARVARTVAWLFNPVLNPNAGPRLEITQEELGLLAGVSRQMANRALQSLECAGLLKAAAGGVEPTNLGALANYGD